MFAYNVCQYFQLNWINTLLALQCNQYMVLDGLFRQYHSMFLQNSRRYFCIFILLPLFVTAHLSVFSPNAGKCGKNVDQNNSKYGHFLRSVLHSQIAVIFADIRLYTSQHLPVQNQKWEHQHMCKMCSKLTKKTQELLQIQGVLQK